MKIYIATPVNARKEGTLEEKREAAWKRVMHLRKIIKETNPKAECHSSFENHIAPINADAGLLNEATIMGRCVTEVMECAAILVDWRYENSRGCVVEHTTAVVYGKKIINAKDLDIEPE